MDCTDRPRGKEDRRCSALNIVGIANVMRMGISIHYLVLANEAKNDLDAANFAPKDTLRKLN